MKQIDRLLQEARRIGSDWRPWSFMIRNTEAGEIYVIVEYWDGTPGSARPENMAARGRVRYERLPPGHLKSKAEAEQLIELYKRVWASAHGFTSPIKTITHDCTQPRTEADRRAIWEAQGGTVLEYWADRDGRPLADVLRENGIDPDTGDYWPEVIQWRREMGKE